MQSRWWFLTYPTLHGKYMEHHQLKHTVDGSEIRRSPVDMVNIPMIYRVLYISGGWEWDF